MMKHFLFLLYLLSYTAGIGTITFLSQCYQRSKLETIKYIVLFNLCFTLSLIFDTLNFYFQIVVNQNSEWVQIFILSGMFIATAGMVYFMGVAVYSGLNKKFLQTLKIIIWGSAVVVFCSLSFFYISFRYGIFPGDIAFHTGYTVINIYTVAGVGYFLCLLIKNLNKLGLKAGGTEITFLIILLLLMPASVLTNLILYKIHFRYPIAFSPLIYFFSNLIMIFLVIRNYLNETLVRSSNQDFLRNERVISSQDAIIKEHNITDREFEILQLILDGKSNQEIGDKLFISANTVRNHISNIFRKFGVKSRYELIKIFY